MGNLVSQIKRRTWVESGEENVWTKEGKSNRRLEKVMTRFVNSIPYQILLR
jgi:hypothetical protein